MPTIHYWAHPLLGMPTTGHAHYRACPLLGSPTTGHTHYWACPLTDGIVLEEKILVEVISRLFCHSSSQAGTELLTQSIIHVIYIEMTLQHQVCRLLVVAYNTRAFEGLSYYSQSKRQEQKPLYFKQA
jgi:hypothetical protein